MTQITISTEEYEQLKKQQYQNLRLTRELDIKRKWQYSYCKRFVELQDRLAKEQQKNEALKNSLIGKFILWLKGVK